MQAQINAGRTASRREDVALIDIGEAIGKGGSEFERIETASRFLWSPQPEGMPFITALGLPLPYGERPSVTAGAAPLASLPPAWRAVTITAIADLLFEETAPDPLLSASFREAFRQFERGPVPAYHQAPPEGGPRQS